eukprot:CAMPEP_0185910336 /NCGR_PEP_ID=MMETSP0196C-20130402/18654_1 /TAXON_ID=2932 /ORGANISM="Alexandrium fundyense, Strain CCMP1719" /LENGTH=40 /DNA_ID= /DNA_START= /DNA_END= /DNA_ORIENTATION=
MYEVTARHLWVLVMRGALHQQRQAAPTLALSGSVLGWFLA